MNNTKDLPGGYGSGGFTRGDVIKDLAALRVGDLLINDNRQFGATNVIRIAGTIRPPHQPGELVDWTFHGRPDDAVLHSMWHWELEKGEYFQAVKK